LSYTIRPPIQFLFHIILKLPDEPPSEDSANSILLPSGQNFNSIRRVKLNARLCELRPASPWKIASTTGAALHRAVIVELTDDDGFTGLRVSRRQIHSRNSST
jgi:hypothetical protein